MLTPGQEEGVAWMIARESPPGALDPLPNVRGGILADEMGMGKTHVIAALMARSPKPTLVIATIATVSHWFATLRTYGLHPCCVMSRDHASTLGEGVVRDCLTVVVTTVSALPTTARTSPLGAPAPAAITEMFSRSWGRIVLDEAHVIRNPTTLVHKTLLRLQAAHRWAVTGTPVQNRERDLQALAAWVGVAGLSVDVIMKQLVLRRVQSGAHASLEREPCGNGMPNSNGVSNSNANSNGVSNSNVVPCAPPPMIRRQIVLDFDAASEEAAIYNVLKAATLVGAGTEGIPIPVAVITRCRQAASHPRMLVAAAAAAHRQVTCASRVEAQHLSGVVRAMASLHESGVLDVARIDPSFGTKARWVVRDLLDAADADPDMRAIVFCDWIDQMCDLQASILADRPDAETWTYHGSMSMAARQVAIRDFAAAGGGHLMVIFVQVQCGAVGLNLQAANRVYMLGPQWNPTVEMQAIGRAHRMGQTRVVQALHVVMRDTVEMHVVKVQARKQKDITSILAQRSGDSEEEQDVRVVKNVHGLLVKMQI